MTKQEAIEAMKEGKRVTHQYFDKDEWIEMDEDGDYMTEQGYWHLPYEFWKFRSSPAWDTGWELFNQMIKEEQS